MNICRCGLSTIAKQLILALRHSKSNRAMLVHDHPIHPVRLHDACIIAKKHVVHQGLCEISFAGPLLRGVRCLRAFQGVRRVL
jgi:hypothetical protein